MKAITESAPRALAAGLAASVAILAVWIVLSGVDGIGLVSFLLRFVHIVAAVLWLATIWFVNFVQFAALQEADDSGRRALMTSIVPRVAHAFRHASHLTLLSGVLLLVAAGYLLDSLVFSAPVYVPPLRSALMWAGVAGGIGMWVIVHFVIWPNLQTVLGLVASDAGDKERARQQVKTYARINLALAVPVTFVMVAAPHLY